MTATDTPDPVVRIEHTPDPDEWEINLEHWGGATTATAINPRYGKGARIWFGGTEVRELDYEDGKLVGPIAPRRPGDDRPGRRFRRRNVEERAAIATAEALTLLPEKLAEGPSPEVVKITRTQTVYVEVDCAYADGEASAVAVERAEVLTDAMWAQGETKVSSGFWSRTMTGTAPEPVGSPTMGPLT